MKKAILTLILTAGMSLCASAQNLVTGPILFDFGTFPKNEVKVHVFEIYNNGKKPLIIKDVKTSCGCTTTKYTRKPIPPKKKGYINVIYNPENDVSGYFKRSVTIISNSKSGDHRLVITGYTVEEKK